MLFEDEVPAALTSAQWKDRDRLVRAVAGTAKGGDDDAHGKAREALEDFDARIRRSTREVD